MSLPIKAKRAKSAGKTCRQAYVLLSTDGKVSCETYALQFEKEKLAPPVGELSAEQTEGGNVSHETLPDKHIHVLNAQPVVEREVDAVADHTRGAAHKTVNAPGRNEHSAQGLVL